MNKRLANNHSELAHYHRSGWLGNRVLFRERVGSTNNWALEWVQKGAEEGLVLLADEQTAGRGRLNRTWSAPSGACLLMSLVFRPRHPFQHNASRITMACGLAMIDAIKAQTMVSAILKWPNDIIVCQKSGWGKLAGMLSEVAIVDEQPAALVVGIGLNVNVPAELLPELAPNAASLLSEGGVMVDRLTLLDAVLSSAEKRIDAFRAGIGVIDEWRRNLAWLGQQVTVVTPTGSVHGIADRVDTEGALILRLPDGSSARFTVGDVSLRQK